MINQLLSIICSWLIIPQLIETSSTSWDTVGWIIWRVNPLLTVKRLAVKTVPVMTYNVSNATLNSTVTSIELLLLRWAHRRQLDMPRHQRSTLGRRAFLSPDQSSGTRLQTKWETTLKTVVLGSHWKHCFSASTSVPSALEVYLYTTMRYINRRFTYLLITLQKWLVDQNCSIACWMNCWWWRTP